MQQNGQLLFQNLEGYGKRIYHYKDMVKIRLK